MQESNKETKKTNLGYRQELNRTLTTKDLVIFGLIAMLPIAPTQVYAAAAVNSFGMAPLVYLVGIIAMIFTALSYSKMSAEFPFAGSSYSFVQRGLNPHVGFLAGWAIVMDYLVVPGLLIAFSNLWLGAVFPDVPKVIIIIAFAAIITFINARGITLTKWANNLFLIAQLSLIAVFIGCAIKFVFIDGHGLGGFSFEPFFQSDKVDFALIATAASIAVLGFLGFDSISTLAEETKEPKKMVGRSVVLSLVLIGLLFMGQAYMASLVHPDYANLDPDMGYFDIIREAGGDVLYYAFIIVGVLSVGIANALAIQSAVSRIIFSMSRDKMLPFSGVLAKVHPKYKTPVNATILIGVASVIIALFVDIGNLIMLVNFGAMTTYALLNISVISHFMLRKKARGFKAVIKYVVSPLIGFGVIAFIWSGFDAKTYIVGFSWLAVGVIVGFIKSNGYKKVPPALEEV